jgi:glycosyltransferase involved in cell wall biosynthesis
MLSEITTIIPTRNRVLLLEKTIISVLQQTDLINQNKIIICDNASRDSTEKLVKEYQKKFKNIKYYKHNKNIGLYQNFSFGISKVNTKYFNVISDDDQLTKNFLKDCINIFNDDNNVDVVIADTLVINQKKNLLAGPFNDYKIGFMKSKEAVIRMSKNLIPRTWTAMLFKKKINYDYSIKPEYGPMADGLWLIDLISQNNVYCIKRIGGVLLSHNDSISQKINIIDEKQITGFNLFKKNFDKNNNYSRAEKDIIINNLEPNVDDIIFKQFFSCIVKNNNDGIEQILDFLKKYKFFKLNTKYIFLKNIFDILFFLKFILKFVNNFRKFNNAILSKYKTRKFKSILKDIL